MLCPDRSYDVSLCR